MSLRKLSTALINRYCEHNVLITEENARRANPSMSITRKSILDFYVQRGAGMGPEKQNLQFLRNFSEFVGIP